MTVNNCLCQQRRTCWTPGTPATYNGQDGYQGGDGSCEIDPDLPPQRQKANRGKKGEAIAQTLATEMTPARRVLDFPKGRPCRLRAKGHLFSGAVEGQGTPNTFPHVSTDNEELKLLDRLPTFWFLGGPPAGEGAFLGWTLAGQVGANTPLFSRLFLVV